MRGRLGGGRDDEDQKDNQAGGRPAGVGIRLSSEERLLPPDRRSALADQSTVSTYRFCDRVYRARTVRCTRGDMGMQSAGG